LGGDFFLEGGGQRGVFGRLESGNLFGCAEDGLSNEGGFRVEVHQIADLMQGAFVHFDYLGEVFDLSLQGGDSATEVAGFIRIAGAPLARELQRCHYKIIIREVLSTHINRQALPLGHALTPLLTRLSTIG
jgi:hypothetical protein